MKRATGMRKTGPGMTGLGMTGFGKKAGAATGALAAAALVAGCGTTGPAHAAGTPMTVQLSPVAYVQQALAKASGDTSVRITGTFDSPSGTGTIDGRERFGSDLGMSLDMKISGLDVSVVLLGDTMYMKAPQLSSELGGKPWAEIDLGALAGSGAAFQAMIGEAKSSDPTQQLEPLLASKDVAKVGTGTVDGVEATQYRGTVDMTAAFSSPQLAKYLTKAQIQQFEQQTTAQGLSSETIDVWIAADGLPVRESIVEHTTAGNATVTMELSDWGQPVTITAPPTNQVTNLTSQVGGALSAQ